MPEFEYIPAREIESAPILDKRLSPNEIDQRYITAYLRDPRAGKTAALRAAGHPNPSRARAWQIHDRLADRIDKELDRMIKQDAALGRATLVHLCQNANSEQVQCAAAVKLMEYADKAKPQKVIHETQSIDDIDREIQVLTDRIRARQNLPDTRQ